MTSGALPELVYERARSVPEALALLQDAGEDSRPISGGQSLVPMMNLGLATPSLLVDVSAIPALRRIEEDGEYLVIGAAVTHHELTTDPLIADHAPLLVRAATNIGSQRIRNRGTIGGSVAHGDAAAELPTCCHVLDAEYLVESPAGRQWRRAQDFSLGYYQTDLAPGELVTAVRIPRRPGWGWGFREYSRRAGDFALASAAAGVSLADGAVAAVALGVTGAADRPMRLDSVEERLLGAVPEDVPRLLRGLAGELDIADDPYCSGTDRARLVEAMAMRALADACAEARRSG